jgi:hypothetical protein
MDYEAEITYIKGTMAILTQAQRTTARAHNIIARVAREAAGAVDDMRVKQAQWDAEHERFAKEMREGWSKHEIRLQEHEVWQKRMDITLTEIGDKLNGLIGYLDGR